GTFQPRVTYAVGTGPWALVVRDFNGDGRLDLAVTDAGDVVFGNGTDPGGVSVLLGNGDGTFQPATEYAAGLAPVAMVAGDFKGDGRLDLAVANLGERFGTDVGDVSVLLGNGDGTFQPPITTSGVTNAATLVAGDFNGDGRLDVATTAGIEGAEG